MQPVLVRDFPLEERFPEVALEDPRTLVRETPPWKVQERWRIIESVRTMRQDAAWHDLWMEAVPTVKPPPRPIGKLRKALDDIGVMICCVAHGPNNVIWQRDQHFVQCAVCKRKYALPWGDPKRMDREVYFTSVPFPVPSNQTRQAPSCHDARDRVDA